MFNVRRLAFQLASRNHIPNPFSKETSSAGKINQNHSRIFNCDETGITSVQHKQTKKVFAMKGNKQISTLTSAERGSLITVVTCMSPAGHFIPPMIIFPRKNMKLELMNGTPPGSIYECHTSGWIQATCLQNSFSTLLTIRNQLRVILCYLF
ncbi:hypothetical protein NQ318_004535 [Aromia moschata]|uniref:DDE-1 domain-containing protein n=1 Tax=Aromia moschata TaxID=1265417 RepID=A0AAV8X335_9CUCU|nr:hypothetical protein NQ318_004535 [Aromia moschata]